MSRADRRAYNRKHKKHLTREQFDAMLAIARIQAGNYDLSDLAVPKNFIHMDNTELVPDGCVCKLNYEEIQKRPADDKLPEFIEWVEEHKDVELHVTRENAENSLICFEEDVRYRTNPETGEEERIPPWLFDCYTDILIKGADGTYKTVSEVEQEQEEAQSAKETAVNSEEDNGIQQQQEEKEEIK